MSNPNNCATCDHKKNPGAGWCYMFRKEPDGVCLAHTMHKGPNAAESIRQAVLAARKLKGVT